MAKYSIRNHKYFGMCTCIVQRDLLINTYSKIFEKYPTEESVPDMKHFGEPGKYERQLGVAINEIEMFSTKTPTLTFSHKPSLGGIRKFTEKDTVTTDNFYWGKSSDIWMKIYGEE